MDNNIKLSLKNKKLMLASWGCMIQTSQECRDWPPVFRKIFKDVILFSFKNESYFNGEEELNRKFLELIEKEKPDYLLVCPAYDEIYLETLVKMKQLHPNMKTIIWFGDDEFRFDDWSRYYALFFDYILTTKKEIEIFKKENHKVDFMIAVNPEYHRPLNIEKIYDVSFIGAPLADRYDYIKFLKENGIKIKLFGGSWQTYEDLKDIYGGFLYPEEFIEKINQTKINLNFSKTFFNQGKKGQMKGRPIEVLACKSFVLTEYTTKTIDFLAKRKEFNFSNKEELLEKIRYYLKHEKQREKLAKEGFVHILKNYTWDSNFTKYFEKIEKEPHINKLLPEINKKVTSISPSDFQLTDIELDKKLKNFDYITFNKNPLHVNPFRDFIQSYSLYISKKQISCCDYYVSSGSFGIYLTLQAKKAFNSISKKDFYKVLNLNQLMVTKTFFLKNKSSFQALFKNEFQNILTDKNTVFVSIPLVKINDFIPLDYESMKLVFKANFFSKIFSIFHKRKFLDPYLFNFLFSFKAGKKFMFEYIWKRIKDRKNWQALDFFH